MLDALCRRQAYLPYVAACATETRLPRKSRCARSTGQQNIAMVHRAPQRPRLGLGSPPPRHATLPGAGSSPTNITSQRWTVGDINTFRAAPPKPPSGEGCRAARSSGRARDTKIHRAELPAFTAGVLQPRYPRSLSYAVHRRRAPLTFCIDSCSGDVASRCGEQVLASTGAGCGRCAAGAASWQVCFLNQLVDFAPDHASNAFEAAAEVKAVAEQSAPEMHPRACMGRKVNDSQPRPVRIRITVVAGVPAARRTPFDDAVADADSRAAYRVAHERRPAPLNVTLATGAARQMRRFRRSIAGPPTMPAPCRSRRRTACSALGRLIAHQALDLTALRACDLPARLYRCNAGALPVPAVYRLNGTAERG